MTITEFLLARLAEDEADWRIVGSRDVEQLLHGRPLVPRMLADIEAKRRIVEAWQENDEMRYSPGFHYRAQTFEKVVRAIASAYADHPDYDPAFRL